MKCDWKKTATDRYRCLRCGAELEHRGKLPIDQMANRLPDCPGKNRASEIQAAAEKLGIALADAVCYAAALARWTKAGFPVRSQEEVQRILREHCEPCDDYVDGRCRECGCKVNGSRFPIVNKIKIATEGCKKKKWLPVAKSPVPEPPAP